VRINVKLPLTFCGLFALAFVILVFVARENLRETIISNGLAPEFADVVVNGTQTVVSIMATLIGALSILTVIWVSRRMTNPISKLSKICNSQDVTDLHKIEIKRGFMDKDDEITDVIQSVNTMIRSVQESDNQKKGFAEVTSHELKTPITVISGFANVLAKSGALGTLNEKQLQAVEKIQRSSKKLEGLISDLLDVQAIDSKKMFFTKTSFDVYDLTCEIISEQALLTKNTEIKLTNLTKKGLIIKTDRKRLSQVFKILIGNSVEFVAQKTGRIDIGTSEEGNKITFNVKDNGSGIAQEDQKNIFKRFYQVDTSIARKHGGMGLGLVICKGIVEGLGGNIWFESKKDYGTTFYFSIPKE
jgi:signal transduction histidine kinase